MLFSDTYLTLQQNSEGVFKDRGSKFISFAFPVRTETEIKEIIQNLKKEHHSARHQCYAWRLGADKQTYRINDDGEPNNSAGKPIFRQIQANDLTDVLIVVVRYFGGTLLGVGGLISAYRESAADAIKKNVIIEKHVLFEYSVEFEFIQMNEVMKLLKDLETKIISQDFNTKCKILFYISKQNSIKLEEKITKLNSIKLNYLKTL